MKTALLTLLLSPLLLCLATASAQPAESAPPDTAYAGRLAVKAGRAAQQEQYLDAADHLLQAHTQFEKALERWPLDTIRTRSLYVRGQAGLYLGLAGRTAQGYDSLNSALAQARKRWPKGHIVTAQLLCSLGQLHYHSGRLPVADTVLAEAATLFRQLVKEFHTGTATAYMWQGWVQLAQGNFPKAMYHMRRCLGVCLRLGYRQGLVYPMAAGGLGWATVASLPAGQPVPLQAQEQLLEADELMAQDPVLNTHSMAVQLRLWRARTAIRAADTKTAASVAQAAWTTPVAGADTSLLHVHAGLLLAQVLHTGGSTAALDTCLAALKLLKNWNGHTAEPAIIPGLLLLARLAAPAGKAQAAMPYEPLAYKVCAANPARYAKADLDNWAKLCQAAGNKTRAEAWRALAAKAPGQ